MWAEFDDYYTREEEYDEQGAKSLLFNAFIFMQVFNEINSRKILDEYNVFEGIFKSPIFFGVLAVTVLLQIVIVQTPINSIFHVKPLNLTEWGISLALGFFSMPLSFITRLISWRFVAVQKRPRGIILVPSTSTIAAS